MRVVIGNKIHPDGVVELKAAGFEVLEPKTEDEFQSSMKDADALVVRSMEVTADTLSLSGRLTCVVRAGSGVDTIDIAACDERGIKVMNCPGGNAIAVAEHALGLILSLARSIPQASAGLHKRWNKSDFLGMEVTGKNLGIIGFGRIGREIAKRAQGLEMRIFAYDPYVSSVVVEGLGVRLVSLEELLTKADVITIHAMLTQETKNLIGAEQLDLMKDEAILINCSRGPLLDEKALLKTMKKGKLRGAGLDVLCEEGEAAVKNPLLQLNNVIITPHLAAQTVEAQSRVAKGAARLVINALTKDRYDNIIGP